MKIALLVDSLGFGGAQRQIVNLAIELKREGKEIFFLRYRDDNFYLELLQKESIVPTTIKGNNLIARALKIRKELVRISPDVVISFMDAPSLYACIASLGQRWKLITSERVAKVEPFQSSKTKWVKRIQAMCSDYIVCNSETAKNIWSRFYPNVQKKLKTIYNIIEIPEYNAQSSMDGKCRILVAARYESVKNIAGMINAVRQLEKEDLDKLEIHWYGKENIVCNGVSELKVAKDMVQEYGLEKCIFLHPATSEIYPLMAKIDYIGLFSLAEGLPNAIIEGMFMHKPVLMSTVSDYDILVSEENGFTFNPENCKEIATVLHKLITQSTHERAMMGECSYTKIRKICSKEHIMEEWNNLISIGEKDECSFRKINR